MYIEDDIGLGEQLKFVLNKFLHVSGSSIVNNLWPDVLK